MSTYKREISKTVAKRLKEKRHFLQVVIGPRQVGKTTAILQLQEAFPDSVYYYSADHPVPPDFRQIEKWWTVANTAGAKVFVIDEIQKIPRWSSMIKLLFDGSRHDLARPQIVLLGSSALSVQKGLQESLAGRFEIISAPHWSFSEMATRL